MIHISKYLWWPPGLKVKPLLCTLLMILLICSGAFAQHTSTSYMLTGGTVGGGGQSSSSGFQATGNVPLTAGGQSASGSYKTTGGTISHLATGALSLAYAGSSLLTVNIVNRTMSITYAGGSGSTITGTFHYRLGGQTTFINHSMTDNGSGTLSYVLNASNLGVRGLEYYFTASQDGITSYIGTYSNPYIFRVSMSNAQGQRPTALPDASYRIVGLPMNPDSPNATTVFEDDLGTANTTQWRLGSYNNTSGNIDEFPSVAAVTPGQGYWLVARGARRYGSAGTSIRPNYTYAGNLYYEVPLDSGWNMIANPLPFNVAFSEIYLDSSGVVFTNHPASLIDNAAHYYNGSGYQNVSTIPAWEGVFIHANQPGISALVRYREHIVPLISPKPLITAIEPDEWSLSLNLKAGDKVDKGNLIGIKQDALEIADQYDFSEPPPAPDAPYLALRLPNDVNKLRMTDFRPEIEEGAIWYIEISEAEGRELTISGLSQIQNIWEVALELDNKTIVYPSNDQPIDIPDGVTSARLIVGNKGYLANEQLAMPDQFSLDQNFPNPFNPMTTIRFVVPSQSHVRLDIHNILGQQVKSLIDETLPRGEYTVTWHGADESEQPVASGIYFYRLSADSFSQCRKMVLLK